MEEKLSFNEYRTEGFYDELFDDRSLPRGEAERLIHQIDALPAGELRERQQAIMRSLLRMGITFAVYGDEEGTEKIFPFDIIPRIVPSFEWQHIESGLRQRIKALNLFINDVYHKQEILNEGIIPRNLIEGAVAFREACRGLNPPRGIWCHITGTDLVRHSDGAIYVLEDNLRCPSGVSYVLQNRQLMKRSFPQAFFESGVRPVVDYPSHLYDSVAIRGSGAHQRTDDRGADARHV